MESHEIREAVLTAPPATIAGLTVAGVSLEESVLILTLVWIGVQLGYFVYQRYKDFTKKS